MWIVRNPQLWLALGRELWLRNRDHHLPQIAASLAFTTTLALVPIITLGSLLLGYLPMMVRLRHATQEFILQTYMPGGINKQVLLYLDQFTAKAKGLTFIGSLGLLFTTILAIAVVEQAFNQIWRVKARRPIYHRVAIYSAATFLGPILLGVGIYFSTLLLSAAEGWTETLSTGLQLLATVLPIGLALAVYTVVYRVLPYAPVSWRDALIGGFCAALVFELTKFGFGFFITKTPFYKTVYGAFAILPLALIWIYITWWVTLAGAVLVANLPVIRAGIDGGRGSKSRAPNKPRQPIVH